MIDTNGVWDIPEHEYHKDPTPLPSLSSSLAKLILTRSPLHAWTNSPRLNPDFRPIEKDAFDLGRAFHSLMLGKGAPIEVVDAETWASKAAREQRELIRLTGRTPMLAAQYEAVEAMVDAARHQLLDGFGIRIDPMRCELAAIAKAEVDGVWCRALIDYAPADPMAALVDLKSCEDASPEACVKAVAGYQYDLQAAHYLDTFEAATGERRGFRFVFVEKAPPYGVSVVELHAGDDDADWMVTAFDKAREARRIWGRCLATNTWPGYPARIAEIGAPTWHVSRWETRARPDAETLTRATEWQRPIGDPL